MTDCSWKTFDEFRNCAFGIWRVTMPANASEANFQNSICTCPTYFKKYTCKHTIGTSLRTIPSLNKIVPLAAKKLLEFVGS